MNHHTVLFAATLCISTFPIAQSTATGSINGYEYVDLGLSVKWATCNVGADSPSDFGDYFAWGEAEAKSTYTENNSVTCNRDTYDYYDAASAERGSLWRSPTDAEWAELIDHCRWTWTTVGGHAGYIVRSRTTGGEIFIPAAGRRINSRTDDCGITGCYSSRSIVPGEASMARCLAFDNVAPQLSTVSRLFGLNVRAVSTAESVYVADASPMTPESAVNEAHILAGEPTHGDLVRNNECVDLGLSVRWARCNIGAALPEDFGNYYAWGETTTKSTYIESNYRVGHHQPEVEHSMSASQNNSASGWTVQPPRLHAPHFSDAAKSKFGGSWRMPTKSECQELIDKCSWQWVVLNGIGGFQVVGPNGNWIFLPAAGVQVGPSVQHENAECHYWSASPIESLEARAWFLYMRHGEAYIDWGNGSQGRCVRPVTR